MSKDERRLKVGVLGCGPIAQAAHCERATKARNADLYAICDVADDLLDRMARTHRPEKTFRDYDAMLADPGLDAVVIATSDAFHVPAALAALKTGKHVLFEKPLGVSVEDVEALKKAVRRSGLVLQVGQMKRFDAGLQSARAFIEAEMGEMLALKSWYCDSTHRYAVTDAVQPLIVTSAHTATPEVLAGLLMVLRDEHRLVRREPVRALGQLRTATPAVLAGLVDVLQDEDRWVRWRAAAALGQLGTAAPAVLAGLVAALRDESSGVRMSAAAGATGGGRGAGPAG